MKVETKITLLKIARESITTYLQGGTPHQSKATDPELIQETGAFVTLRTKGNLRGCIGQMMGYGTPLNLVIQEKAIAAATEDPRFPPMTEEELADLEIEISVLTPMRKIKDVKEIEIGKHGVLLEKYGRRGVLLPEVPVEYGWDLHTFLEHLCMKAGLPPGSWHKDATLYVFSSEKMSEENDLL